MSSEICNFADDNTIYTCGNDIHEIVMVLENDLCKLLERFTCNGVVVSPNKFQLIFLGLRQKQKLCINSNGVKILVKNMPSFLELKLITS